MSHLAEADDPSSSVTERQRKLFGELLAQVRDAGFEPEWTHLDNSAGIVRGATPGTTAVRPGLALFGADPTLEGGHALEPVMTLCSRVCQAKDVPAGTRIGYGGTYQTQAATRILTLPIGYADGGAGPGRGHDRLRDPGPDRFAHPAGDPLSGGCTIRQALRAAKAAG